VNRVAAQLLPVLGLVGLVWAGNGLLNNDDEIVLEAVFDDVKELVPRHLVMTADVPIGTVTDVQLTDDFRALVTMEVRPDTGLPADVAAVVKRTQVLGEHHVDLVPLSDEGELESGVLTETHTADERTYTVVIEPAEEGGYVVTCPSLRGVATQGETLAERDDQLVTLMKDGNELLSELSARRDAISSLLQGIQELAAELEGLVDDNNEQIGPVLDELDQLTGMLDRNRDSLAENIKAFAPFLRQFNNVIGTGRWFDNYVCGLLLPQRDDPVTVNEQGCDPR
jgi:ABC-type transporter Mla subunit MlaD